MHPTEMPSKSEQCRTCRRQDLKGMLPRCSDFMTFTRILAVLLQQPHGRRHGGLHHWQQFVTRSLRHSDGRLLRETVSAAAAVAGVAPVLANQSLTELSIQLPHRSGVMCSTSRLDRLCATCRFQSATARCCSALSMMHPSAAMLPERCEQARA